MKNISGDKKRFVQELINMQGLERGTFFRGWKTRVCILNIFLVQDNKLALDYMENYNDIFFGYDWGEYFNNFLKN